MELDKEKSTCKKTRKMKTAVLQGRRKRPREELHIEGCTDIDLAINTNHQANNSCGIPSVASIGSFDMQEIDNEAWESFDDNTSIVLDVFSDDEGNQLELQQPGILRILPEDVVGHVLSFLGSKEDRFALQCTCVEFRRVSNSESMLKAVNLLGDENGHHSIIQTDDTTPEIASISLAPFLQSGNTDAMYIQAMLELYCKENLDKGFLLLKMASEFGHLRSMFILGIVLQQTYPDISQKYLETAAARSFLPATYELNRIRNIEIGDAPLHQLKQYVMPTHRLEILLFNHRRRLKDIGVFQERDTMGCHSRYCGRWVYYRSGGKAHVDNCSERSPSNLDFHINRLTVQNAFWACHCRRAVYCSMVCWLVDKKNNHGGREENLSCFPVRVVTQGST